MSAKSTTSRIRSGAPTKPAGDWGINLTPTGVYRLVGGVAAFGLLLVVVAALTFGRPKATLNGRVTYKGKPVVWGSVILVDERGYATAGRIEPDGTYTVDGASPATVNVAVISQDPLYQHHATQLKITRERLSLKKRPPMPVDRKLWFPLPKQYEDPKTSGLSLPLKRGNNEFNIELR
jgi:hypothetical protein